MASDYSVALVAVKPVGASSYTNLPTPSDYKMTSSTLVNNSRSAKGFVVGTVVRDGIRKIEMVWNYLDQTQFSTIAKLFEPSARGGDTYGNFFVYVKFYDTIIGAYVDSQTDYLPTNDDGTTIPRQFYCGDRVSDTAKVKLDSNGKVVGYANVKLSLIEC